jgi:hypothetical protein
VPVGKGRPGTVPALALKVGTLLTTLTVFAGSFGYANAHLYNANAPLAPAVVATSSTTASRSTTSLSSSVRTTSRTPVTTTRSS